MKHHETTEHRIHILPENLSNQIAAGEVVERPASVIKELVENALDAEATKVFIEVMDGGRKRIRVIDNGRGMSRPDAALAVRRHATSKIKAEGDLAAIGTLGFRGEALPSIASVSRFSLTTRTSNTNIGTQLRIDGGDQQEIGDAGCPTGTTIDISDLFYNVPARLKFMKSKATEMSHINQLVTGFALGHPNVHFRLTTNGRKTADYPRESNLKARIYSVLGSKACARLYETHLDADIQIHGFTSDPGFSKGGTQGIYTYINGRQVRDKLLLRAIATSYGNYLERGRYPHAILYLTIPPEWVDVNVHPTKHEVRFVHGGRVFECVCRALKMTLESAPWGQPGESGEQLPEPTNLHLWSAPKPQQEQNSTSETFHQDKGSFQPTRKPSPAHYFRPPASNHESLHTMTVPRVGNFLVVQQEERLLLIHRRRATAYLTLRDIQHQHDNGHVLRQRLLFPEQFQVAPDIVQWVSEQPVLESFGFCLEAFGEGTIVLKEIPLALAGTGQHIAVVEEMTSQKHVALPDVLRLIAKHTSRGDLTEADDQKLAQALAEGKLPENCEEFGKLTHSCHLHEIQRWFGSDAR